MFRRQLSLALAALASASVLQGAAALWALNVADEHTRHGRVTGDIHLVFVTLSATKQRLRTWVSQALLGADAHAAERQRLEQDLSLQIAELRALSQQAIAMGEGLDEDDRRAQLRRLQSLDVLERGFARLSTAIDAVRPLPAGANARQAWETVNAVFEVSEGQNLRELVAEGIDRASASVARERAAANRTLRWMRGLSLGTAAGLALAALLLARYFARALRQPLDDLATGAAALQRGDLAHRIPVGRSNEIAAVARSFNAMAEELQQHRQREDDARLKLQELVDARTSELRSALTSLQQADARRRQLFADISHELRTPTTAIRGEAEVVLRGGDKPGAEYREALRRIVETSRQLGVVIDDLLSMARSDTDALALDRMPIDLAEPLLEALEQMAAVARQRDIRIDLVQALPKGLSVIGDPQRLRQLFMVLLDNAVHYSHRHGQLQVELAAVQDGQGRRLAEVRVTDQGIGIAPDELQRVFDRRFRGAQARVHRAEGLGLGLAIGAALAQAHGGSIHFDSAAGQGTTAIVRLPLLSEPDWLLGQP